MFFLKRNQSILKLFIIFISIFTLHFCDKPYDDIVDYQLSNYLVDKILVVNEFNYSPSDSLLNVGITFKNFKSVEKVYLNIKLNDASSFIYKEIELDKVVSGSIAEFSTKIKLSKKFSSGKYIIEFFVKDKFTSTEKKVAEHLLSYNNNQVNYPPVISDLKIPSFVNRGESFTFSLKVNDPNGLNDINQVIFKLFRPDGSVVISNSSNPNIDYFLMVDNGDINLGDEKANDGIYSFKNSFGQNSSVGNWTFEFQAKDKSGAASNALKSIVEVR